jgi:hypothetical protein
MVRAKKVCAECGKKVYVGAGVLTEWRDLQRLSQPTFFCFPCIKKIERTGSDRRNAAVLAVRKSWAQPKQSPSKEQMEQTMIEVLRNLCSTQDWYALRTLTKSYQAHYPGTDPMAVSNILFSLGFNQRARKKRGSYTYVFVDPEKILLRHRS